MQRITLGLLVAGFLGWIGVESTADVARATPILRNASGYGLETAAGRGGTILRVTTLSDAGPGSLRAALEHPGPRIVVFEVAGSIHLRSGNLEIREPFLTVAGQSAPSPGITLVGGTVSIATHDVLLQHLRIRVGDLPEGSPPPLRDGLQISGPAAYNIVVDHCSISWAIDENVGINGGAREITIMNSIISEGLDNSINAKGRHSKAILVGEHCKVALIGNLLVSNDDRHPNVKGGATVLLVNNLNYNGGERWVPLSDDEQSGPIFLTAVGNVFLNGPNSSAETIFSIHKTVPPGSQIYVADTLHTSPVLLRNQTSFNPVVSDPPTWLSTLIPLPSQEVENAVLARAGARPADRDPVDQRIVAEVRSGTGSLVDSPAQVGGWPELPVVIRPLVFPENLHADPDQDGYTVIEDVLHAWSLQLEGNP